MQVGKVLYWIFKATSFGCFLFALFGFVVFTIVKTMKNVNRPIQIIFYALVLCGMFFYLGGKNEKR